MTNRALVFQAGSERTITALTDTLLERLTVRSVWDNPEISEIRTDGKHFCYVEGRAGEVARLLFLERVPGFVTFDLADYERPKPHIPQPGSIK